MNKTAGFTLVELIITLSIAAILVTVGIPSFRSVMADSRLVTFANKFVSDLALARSSAVKYQRNAQMCVSTNYNAANPTCTGGNNWDAGWIVWVDKNRNNLVDVGNNEVIRVGEPAPGATTFVSAAASNFTYNARGFVNAGDTLTLCDDRTAETGRSVVVRPSGHANTNQTACP